MNIREVIKRLQEVAAKLPDGLDSEVCIHICHGHDTPGVMTPSIEVDMMWVQDQRTLEVKDSFAIVQGHPHRDQNTDSTTRPVTMEVDEVVQRWAAEQASDSYPVVGGGGPTTPSWDFGVDPDSGARYVVIHRLGQKSIKMELSDEGKIRYLPGAPDAVAAGCICDPSRNNHGGGGAGEHDDGTSFIIKTGCPLHDLIDPPA